MQRKVVVIIPTFNNEYGLKKCIHALLTSSYENLNMVVVNNGKLKKSVAQSVSGRVSYIKNDDNLGFARACNIGAKFAIEFHRANYLFFLNDDCVVGRNCVAEMVSSFNIWPECVGMSPIIRDGGTKIHFSGGNIYRKLGFCTHTKEIGWANYTTDYLTGAAMMVRANDFTGFDERFFMYFEDVDLSLRLRNMGTLMVDPMAMVRHEVSSSVSWFAKWKMQFQSGVKFHAKWNRLNPTAWVGFLIFMGLKLIKNAR